MVYCYYFEQFGSKHEEGGSKFHDYTLTSPCGNEANNFIDYYEIRE
jgi:hypothetical protein